MGHKSVAIGDRMGFRSHFVVVKRVYLYISFTCVILTQHLEIQTQGIFRECHNLEMERRQRDGIDF